MLAQWQRFRDLSIARYKKTYGRLNIHFDSYSGRSTKNSLSSHT